MDSCTWLIMPGIKYFQRCLDITEGLQHVGRAPGKSPYDSSSLSSTFTQSIFDKCTLLHFSFSSHRKIMTVALQEGINVDT